MEKEVKTGKRLLLRGVQLGTLFMAVVAGVAGLQFLGVINVVGGGGNGKRANGQMRNPRREYTPAEKGMVQADPTSKKGMQMGLVEEPAGIAWTPADDGVDVGKPGSSVAHRAQRAKTSSPPRYSDLYRADVDLSVPTTLNRPKPVLTPAPKTVGPDGVGIAYADRLGNLYREADNVVANEGERQIPLELRMLPQK
jgi:hypothetical protein